MDRMTKKKLLARLDWVNDALGNDREAFTKTDNGLRANSGTITLDWAYGRVKVCRMIGSGGGEADLSMRGTMRDAATFLDAMLTGIKIEQGNRK